MAKAVSRTVRPEGRQLYDEDIVLWSEQQAGALRALHTLRNPPVELDIDNVAEEIEAVGRAETAAVKSFTRLILLHLAKMAIEPDSQAVAHWRGEIIAFREELIERFAPSMRQRIDIDHSWQSVVDQLLVSTQGAARDHAERLPRRSPVGVDELLNGSNNLVQTFLERIGADH